VDWVSCKTEPKMVIGLGCQTRPEKRNLPTIIVASNYQQSIRFLYSRDSVVLPIEALSTMGRSLPGSIEHGIGNCCHPLPEAYRTQTSSVGRSTRQSLRHKYHGPSLAISWRLLLKTEICWIVFLCRSFHDLHYDKGNNSTILQGELPRFSKAFLRRSE